MPSKPINGLQFAGEVGDRFVRYRIVPDESNDVVQILSDWKQTVLRLGAKEAAPPAIVQDAFEEYQRLAKQLPFWRSDGGASAEVLVKNGDVQVVGLFKPGMHPEYQNRICLQVVDMATNPLNLVLPDGGRLGKEQAVSGAARLLMQVALSEFTTAQPGASCVALRSRPNTEAFYEHLGFRRVNNLMVLDGDALSDFLAGRSN
jgi:hypothetical protein